MKMLRVKVRPNARVDALVAQEDGSWVAQVKAPPVDGKANDALIALIAQHFARRKSQVTVKHGATARIKLVSVDED